MAQTPHADQVGKKGEYIATKYLINKGYKIIDQNFHAVRGEIDIIAADLKTKQVVFVEVKTRTNERYGSIYETINKYKFKKILCAAEEWFFKTMYRRVQFPPYRVDAILITLSKSFETTVEHIQNIGWDDF